MKGIRKTGEDYNAKALYERIDSLNLYSNIVKTYQKEGRNKSALCFCINVEHSQKICEAFRQAGYNAFHCDSDTNKTDRLKALQSLNNPEKPTIVTNCNIFAVGVDVPKLEVCILARPTQSEILYIQQVGRALRISPGKKKAIIIDHAGNCARLGPPDMLRTPLHFKVYDNDGQ